jgi:hypothetical protein
VSVAEVVIDLAAALLVNEISDVSPWAAHKITHRVAYWRHSSDPECAKVCADELRDLIDKQPGKLIKLVVAFVGDLASGAPALHMT